MWKIVVFMVLGLGTDQEVYPLTGEEDALVITHHQGKPLTFRTQESCYTYMWKNVDGIREYASSRFEGKPVRQIICSDQQEV